MLDNRGCNLKSPWRYLRAALQVDDSCDRNAIALMVGQQWVTTEDGVHGCDVSSMLCLLFVHIVPLRGGAREQ